MKRLLIFAAVLAALAAPASAQPAPWRHAKSGVSVPAEIGVMRLGEVRDLSGGKGWDVMVQYGQDTEPVTLYVYRSAYPNPALWFERTRVAMRANVGAPLEGVAPRSFTLGGASAPNGLREELVLPTGGAWKSTAVAIAQIGEWMVKARVTSQTLDGAGISAKMDSLLAALAFANATPAPVPLLVPGPCPDSPALRGEKLARVRDEANAHALVTGLVVLAEVRGVSGLAAEPSAWCRAQSGLPAEYVSLYRKRDGSAWVALLADSGRAVAAHKFLARSKQGAAATFGSDPAATRVAAVYDGLPAPDAAVLDAIPVAVGQAPGLGSISTDAGGGDR
jgi:hypothetical protein